MFAGPVQGDYYIRNTKFNGDVQYYNIVGRVFVVRGDDAKWIFLKKGLNEEPDLANQV